MKIRVNILTIVYFQNSLDQFFDHKRQHALINSKGYFVVKRKKIVLNSGLENIGYT